MRHTSKVACLPVLYGTRYSTPHSQTDSEHSKTMILQIISISILFHALMVTPFQAQIHAMFNGRSSRASVVVGSSTAASSYLFSPEERDAHYDGNIAQYLVDLHNNKSTFNFCGGMMFELVLSEKLKKHLEGVAATSSSPATEQPVVFDASHPRMHQVSGYNQCADADNIRIFHGREIRQVPNANGGMGFVLQLSHSDEDDPEGWTSEEVKGYDGWGHDSGRVWRKGDRHEKEGFSEFRSKFGPNAFSLHHRFYLHYDKYNSMWLSAEDGCEGTPAPDSGGIANRIAALMGLGA